MMIECAGRRRYERSSAAMRKQGKYVILIVDNGAETRETLTAILDDDYRVTAVSDGASALRAVSLNRPDLILLNVVLPDMDGFELCERIKEQEDLRDVPVIFISAFGETPDKVLAFRAGTVDYVANPIHPGEVRARVATHLKNRQLQADLESQNAKLRKSLGELKRAEKLKNDLMHMILHDMRTPLSTISMGLFLTAESGAHLDEKERGYLAMAQSASQELSILVNGFLDVLRLESGNVPLQLEQRDVKILAEKSVESSNLQANLGGITIRVTGDQAIGMVDPALINRVFEKLIATAMGYAQRGGDVEVRVISGPAAIRAEVRTTGGGLPGENEKISGKFSQVSLQAENQRLSGGFGLAFCRLAIEAHQGRIGVTGEKETGGLFWFELPAGTTRRTGEDRLADRE